MVSMATEISTILLQEFCNNLDYAINTCGFAIVAIPQL